MENLAEDWHPDIKTCLKEYADKKTKLWSFEVKLLLNRSNVRSAFFQAVSISSWADFGYLVAGAIEGTATMRELRMLSGLHGIGFIQLDPENPSESQILIPARERPEIDWASCNRLASENADFQDFISLVCQFYQTGKAKLADWDLPKEP
ncbi:MAG: hypothetical protein WAS73_03990 [Defluviicoccus sp.]